MWFKIRHTFLVGADFWKHFCTSSTEGLFVFLLGGIPSTMVLIEGGFLFIAEALAICLGVKSALSGSHWKNKMKT